MPRGEVGQARPRRSRGAAEGERARPSGGPYHPQGGGEPPATPHPHHGHIQRGAGGTRGGAPAPRVVQPDPPVPAVHGDGRASRPAPAAGPTWLRRGPGGVSGAGPLGVTSPVRAGSAAWAPPGRRGRRAPAPPPRGSPQRWASRPTGCEGRPSAQRSAPALPGCACLVNPFLLCLGSSWVW